MAVNVKQAERRELHFDSLDAILADAEAVTAGPHRVTGNHTAAQLIHHIAVPMDKAVNGFDFDAPLVMKVFGRVLKVFGVDRPIKPGIRPPKSVEERFWAPADISLDEAIVYLRRSVKAANVPGSMTHPSPLFGKMTHEQWLGLNYRHAELHLGFIHPA